MGCDDANVQTTWKKTSRKEKHVAGQQPIRSAASNIWKVRTGPETHLQPGDPALPSKLPPHVPQFEDDLWHHPVPSSPQSPHEDPNLQHPPPMPGVGVGLGMGDLPPSTTPFRSKSPPTCLVNAAGHLTARNLTPDGSPLLQPHAAKSLQPFLNAGSSWLQRWAHCAVFWQELYHLPRASLCCLLRKPVPGLPQMLAVEYCKLSNPGAATSKCGMPLLQPFVCGGQRFFFMTTAVHDDCTASGTWIRRHFPQPPSPDPPQQPSSGPIK